MTRYLAKTRKRTGGFTCLRCEQRFSGRDAYDRHLVTYPEGDWCHLAEEVGLVAGPGGWWRLPETGSLELAPGVAEQGGVPRFSASTPVRTRGSNRQGAALAEAVAL